MRSCLNNGQIGIEITSVLRKWSCTGQRRRYASYRDWEGTLREPTGNGERSAELTREILLTAYPTLSESERIRAKVAMTCPCQREARIEGQIVKTLGVVHPIEKLYFRFCRKVRIA